MVCMIFQSKDLVLATNFAGNEDEYTELCQNTDSLSKSDLQVCSEFSDYLKNKNSNLENTINDTQSKLNDTMKDLEQAQTQLASTEQQIASVQSELSVLEASITLLNQNIASKKEQLKDRMYVLQSYVNGNELIYLLFSAGNLDELLTRVQCIDELTTYDKELIVGLAQDKANLESQNDELLVQYDHLFALQSQQTSLMSALNQTADKYQSSLGEQNTLLSNYREDIGYIDSSLSEAERRIQAEEQRRKEEEEAKKEEENNQKPSDDDPSTPSEPETPSRPSDDDIGWAIANTALSKNGCEYVYGGTGPDVFDCSGLAQWSYRQNGIYIPRTVTYQYYACTLLSMSELAPGDLVFFDTMGDLSHVGIYIGDGQFIHAGTESSGVYISNLYSSYWQNIYHGAGRFR